MVDHVLPPSAKRDILTPHARSLLDLGRDRPFIPATLTDLDDVIDDQGVHDGQYIGYDFATGDYYHRSRQVTFSQQPPGQPITASSTDALDLAYPGILRHIHVRVTTAGTGDIDFSVYVNGVLIDTLTLAAGQLTGDLDFANVPVALIDAVVITTSGGDAVGLTGWILI